MSQSIFSTLAYHSIFGYPLTLDEIHRYLISAESISLPKVKQGINNLVKAGKVYSRNGFYQPSALSPQPLILIKLRQRRKEISQKKLMIAERVSRMISIIPWVKMIAVTGALAMENADKDDDIDLMIVASRNRLWIVRLLVFLIVSLFFKRRKPLNLSNHLNHSSTNNCICLNLWLDEQALVIPVGQRNLYTAHELAQMKPVINKDGTYERMMVENSWGNKYLTNTWKDFNHSNHSNHSNNLSPFNLFNLLNLLAFNLQFQFMKPKMTNERVSLHSAFFHPGNRADTILKTYDRFCHRSF